MPPTPGNSMREELWAAVGRDSQGMRNLQQFLDGIKDVDDDAFAQATGGADRADMMAVLSRLNALLAELDRLAAQLHPGAS